MTTHEPIGYGCLLALLPAALLLSSCDTPSRSVTEDPIPVHPFASGHTGPSGTPLEELPPPVPMAADGGTARGVASATVIDTRTFDPQVIQRGPWRGETKRPGAILPKHSRDKTLRPGKPNDLKAGGLTGRPRIDTEPSVLFPGIIQSPWTPPDPCIAVGPEHVVETVNMEIAWYEKDGTPIFQQRLDSSGDPGFFEELGAGDFTFDPKCFYDPFRKRYVVLALEHYTNESWITIAVSDDEDPNGLWYKYRTWALPEIEDTTYWVDYPGFGFDAEGWYVTNNLFREEGPGGGFGGTLLRSYDPTGALDGGDLAFVDLLLPGGSHQVAQVPGGGSPVILVKTDDSTGLRLVAVSDPLGTPISSSVKVTVPEFAYPDDRPPTPGGDNLNPLDGRIMNVTIRNGRLWTGHAIRTPDNSTTVGRWYEIDLKGWPEDSLAIPELAQSGEIRPGEGVHTCFPAIAVNDSGKVAVVYTRSSTEELPTLSVAGRVPSDPPGTLGEEVRLAISTDVPSGGGVYRWGDYFDATIDPEDDGLFWVVGQIYGEGGWVTEISSFVVRVIGDLDEDGVVDGSDLTILLGSWGESDPLADLNGDGTVDGADLTIMLGNWN